MIYYFASWGAPLTWDIHEVLRKSSLQMIEDEHRIMEISASTYEARIISDLKHTSVDEFYGVKFEADVTFALGMIHVEFLVYDLTARERIQATRVFFYEKKKNGSPCLNGMVTRTTTPKQCIHFFLPSMHARIDGKERDHRLRADRP